MMIVTLASVLLFILLTMDYCQNRQCISTWHARPKIAIHISFPRDVLHEKLLCLSISFISSAIFALSGASDTPTISNIQFEDLCIHQCMISASKKTETHRMTGPFVVQIAAHIPLGILTICGWIPRTISKIDNKKGCFPKLINESSMTTYEILWIV